MLAIGRGLMASPRFLLLDEPSLETGRICAAGAAVEIAADPRVRSAYLGA